MQIKDLTGLSKPITRLIEVSSVGIGKLTEAHFHKKMSDAKAYEIKVVSEAISDAKGVVDKVSYDRSELFASCTQQGIEEERVEATLQLLERTNQRFIAQESKRQENIESVISEAADILKDEDEVPENKPDHDWTTRFFRYSEDISSSSEMQTFWGKILAGEIKKPDTYSLRFLDVIRNISPDEAELFCKVCNYGIESGNGEIFFLREHSFYTQQGLKFSDLLLLSDIGLINLDPSLTYDMPAVASSGKFNLLYSDYLVIINVEGSLPSVALQICTFTTIGKEVKTLVETKLSVEYLTILASKFKIHKGISVSYAKIISYDGQNVSYETPVCL